MDEIRIEGLEVFAYHGVLSEEQKNGQKFIVNAVLHTNFRRAVAEDNIELTVDYGKVCQLISDWMHENTCRLIETAAQRLAREIMLRFDGVRAVDLEIRKPQAPIPLDFGCVSVKVHREWHTAYLAFGSNVGDRAAHIARAVEMLKSNSDIVVMQMSKTILSKPYGPVEQNDFFNGVMRVETFLSPHELLEALRDVEKAEKRDRTVRWGPRTLDLDIIFYDKLVIEDFDLIIPHVDMQNRDFVLEPMCEIAEWYRHPVLGKTMRELLNDLKNKTEENKA